MNALLFFIIVFAVIPSLLSIKPRSNTITQFLNNVLIPLLIIAAFFYLFIQQERAYSLISQKHNPNDSSTFRNGLYTCNDNRNNNYPCYCISRKCYTITNLRQAISIKKMASKLSRKPYLYLKVILNTYLTQQKNGHFCFSM